MKTGWLLFAALVLVWGNAVQAEHYPEPEFAGPVVVDRSTIVLGESFTLTASLQNSNSVSLGRGSGRILVSFPGFTASEDHQSISDAGSSTGDLGRYLEHVTGETGVYCTSSAVPNLVVEYADSLWDALETNTLKVSVTPPETGTFVMDVRGTMVASYDPSCSLAISVVPSNGDSGFTDAAGEAVKRFVVTVESPTPVRDASWGSLKIRYN